MKTIALFAMLVALPALADEGSLPGALAVLARCHLFLLHFPIVLVVTVLAIELLPRKQSTGALGCPWRREATTLLLPLAAAGAACAAITGLLYAADEDWHGSTEALMLQHRAGGIVTAMLAITATIAQRRDALKSAYRPLIVVAVISVLFTGHRGGQLVHGEDYLLEPYGSETEKDDGPDRIVASDGDENADEQRLRHPEGTVPDAPSYLSDIKPIIDRSCLKCHGPEKRKSGLRLDKKRFALKGGETGPAVVPSDVSASLMHKYVSLPPDDEDVMPSKGKLLALSEIETIRKWIAAGADWPGD
jgi:uncharacterized membrane protein